MFYPMLAFSDDSQGEECPRSLLICSSRLGHVIIWAKVPWVIVNSMATP